MQLPEDDENYLNGKGYRWELITEPSGGLLILYDFAVNAEKYDRDTCDLLIKIPAQYNMAALDMWYVSPPVRLKSGEFPIQAAHMEPHAGREWQRFSRHLDSWRPGVDTIRTMISFAERELKGKQ